MVALESGNGFMGVFWEAKKEKTFVVLALVRSVVQQ